MSESRFSIVPSDAVTDLELTSTQLRVLLVIGTYLSKDATAFPKQKTIAERLSIARETVNRAVKVLSEKGYIQVHHQKRDDGGQRANLYTVKLDPCDPSVTPPVTSRDHTPCDHTGSHLRTTHKNDTSSDEEVLEREPAPPPRKKKRTSGQTQIPTDWKPTASDIEYARKQNLTDQEIQNEADRFYRHHRAKGSRWKNWHLVWTNWLQSDFGPIKRKQRDAGRDSGPASRGKPEASTFQAAAARMRRELQSCGQQVPAEGGMDPRDEAPGHDQAELGFVINQ